MTVLSVVDVEMDGRRLRFLRTPAGWHVQGNPNSLLPSILDRVSRLVEHSGADPAPLWTEARHIAAYLGGEVRWVRKSRTKPGWIN